MLVLELVIILLAAKLAGSISVKMGQPSVLGQLVAGIVIGPSLLGWVNNSEILQELSNVGVILLMFIAGLETNLREFRASAKASTAVGIGGIILPLAGGYASGMMLGLSPFESMFFGLVLTATSVSISVQTLRELGKLKSKEGATILGAAVLDDIAVIILLALLMSLIDSGVSVGMVVLKKFLFFAAAILIAWKVVPWVMNRFAHSGIQQAPLVLAVILCFSFAYFAEATGVAGIIGAYLAGIAISTTRMQEEMIEKVEVLSYGIFVPIFFVSIGISTQISGVDGMWMVIPLSLLAILAKLIGSGLGAKWVGFSWRSSLGIGAGMVSRGEVALILAALGLEQGIIEGSMFSVLIMVVLVTTIVTPPILKVLFQEKNVVAVEK
ncbi:cation:proton antiporter [Brevibacillus humidisoli]|uniref:cation:proton antiporter n=1 Tax=Brevibacillus humidisoli TaxID=2895522 RepID=UPI001E282FA3|nr:cation:proton antiporter [Brevibacillus humidisoli]UFJ39512.1 cation:proton antiporter [Brevibacillus humidisoli]